MGLVGALCVERLFQTLQSEDVFLAVKTEGRGKGRETCTVEPKARL